MACGCKANKIGQPTAIKQVVKNRVVSNKSQKTTPQAIRASKENVVRRIIKHPIF